ncbi:MAG TPA: hypothetical protein DD979_06145 [Gammaproteobacteria bacterium]|nr:hypothetical protein [Gammaproteobacteria bacterium]
MKIKTLLFQTLLLASISFYLTACSDDDDDSPDNGATNGSGNGAENGSANGSDNGSSSESPLYLVKSTEWSTDDGISLIYLTDSLDTNTEFNREQALAIDGYHYVNVNESGDDTETVFHLAVDNTSRLQRYVISNSNEFALDAEMDFSAHGITDARNAMRSGKIFSAEKGVIVDFETMQVIIFNPTTMTITTTVDLSEHAEADYPNRWSIFPAIDGDRVVVPITFYKDDWSPVALSKLVIVDTKTDTVTVDASTQCGSVSASAVDTAGNLYFAASPDIAAQHAIGAEGSFAPCIIRMKAGADGWDDEYYVDMTTLTEDGRPAYAIMTGTGNTAYTLIYSDTADPITVDNIDEATRQIVWEFHSLELGNEAAGVTKIVGAEPTGHRVHYGSFANGDSLTAWNNRINDDFTESTVYDTTDPTNWEVLTVIPGALETIARLR